MMYSDHENYPYNEDWLLWKAIEEKTNVTFDLTIVARTDYNDKVSASVNSGSAPYIIPKLMILLLTKTAVRLFQSVTGFSTCRTIKNA